KMLEFQRNGFLIVIITNQSGIARGFISEKQYAEVNTRMLELLEKEGVEISDVFMCPSHPDENDPRRKPNPGMILEAAQKFDVGLSESVLAGDSGSDLEAGKRAGVLSLTVSELLTFSF
ncbi:MAG: HAD-IIIA family hydrolase, partial [Candidatus ainarchaeum sp.]|nr:HAD-IIIA family hydrolase [Candidatus ainarchaeum sp.]